MSEKERIMHSPNSFAGIKEWKIIKTRKRKKLGKIIETLFVYLVIGLIFSGLIDTVDAASFSIGDTVEATTNLNVCTGAGTSYSEITDSDYSGYAPTGTIGKILSGPSSADGYVWWEVDFGPGLYSGWSVEDGFKAEMKVEEMSGQVPDLFPVFMQTDFGYADSKYGYIDRNGKVIIKPQFDHAGDFSEGLAPAKVREEGLFGYINTKGVFAIKPQFDNAKEFSQGLAAILVETKWGYIDRTGSLTISPQFQDAGSFSERFAAIVSDGKWGYIDITGVFAIKPQFDNAKEFSRGLAPVFAGGKWGFIDRTGTFVIEPQFDEADAYSAGLAPVLIDKKWGYIDKHGNQIIRPQFDDAATFSEGYARIGVETESLSLESVGGIPLSLSAHIHNIYGYINKSGETIIKPQFEYAGNFRKGLAWVNTGQAAKEGVRTVNREGYIDTTGAFVWNPTNKVELELSESEKLFRQLRSQNLQQHFGAALALAKLGKSAVPELIKLINDERWYVGITAIWILGEIGNQAALDPLIEALGSEEKIGPSGYTSYIGDMSFKPQKDLALYDSPDSFPSWNLLFKRRAVAIALGNIGDQRAIEPLNEILQEGHTEVKVAVAKALKKITGKNLGEDYERELKEWEARGYR